MTFGVLTAYRRCKIGTMMINELQEMMKNNKNVKVFIYTKLKIFKIIIFNRDYICMFKQATKLPLISMKI